ncbi:transmembrane protein 220 isoform X1 [Erpetoichthys calabaricus]|uniref:Transmembrane protein 220 n=1 Tax=Erpetoichthys calabaricus TaxID=27687 RepID=A0A8C4TKF6_ERPCA|nr:transmembrane protein 220 isoform X1 [Erpetoichthys calabaricus]
MKSEASKRELSSSFLRCFPAMWRMCNFCMGCFFALAAYVQVNDPDAGIWMAAYIIPSGLCFMVCVIPAITENLIWSQLSDLHMASCLIVAGALGLSVYRNATKNILHEEEGREFFGLLLVAVWLLLCRRSGKNPVGGLRLSAAGVIVAFPFVAWLYYHVNTHLRDSWPSHCKTAL